MTKTILENFIRKAVGTDLKTTVLKAELHRWRAAMFEMLAYLAMARHSDLARLEMTDVEIREDRLVLSFNTRKNDQGHRGHNVMILATNDELCPVALFRKYQSRLSSSLGKAFYGPVIPSFSKKKGVYSPTMSAASWWTVRAIQKKMLVSNNIDPRFFGCHSGRRGGCTDSAGAGIAYAEIADFAGWTKDSLMPAHYDEMGRDRGRVKAAMSLKLGANGSSKSKLKSKSKGKTCGSKSKAR
jgi:integrase